LAEALAFLPEVRLEGEEALRAAHGVRVDAPAAAAGAAREVAAGAVRLTDAGGLIALAEPVPGTFQLKPIVGFRG
jgi:hypothetical protein